MTQMHLSGVRFVGIDKLHLDSFTAQELQRACMRCMERLRERVGDLVDVIVRLKARRLPGDLERYTATIELNFAGGGSSATAEDWYLTNAVRDAFGKVEGQIENASLEV